MPERRVSDIVDQSGTLQDMADILFHLLGKPGVHISGQKLLPDVLSQ